MLVIVDHLADDLSISGQTRRVGPRSYRVMNARGYNMSSYELRPPPSAYLRRKHDAVVSSPAIQKDALSLVAAAATSGVFTTCAETVRRTSSRPFLAVQRPRAPKQNRTRACNSTVQKKHGPRAYIIVLFGLARGSSSLQVRGRAAAAAAAAGSVQWASTMPVDSISSAAVTAAAIRYKCQQTIMPLPTVGCSPTPSVPQRTHTTQRPPMRPAGRRIPTHCRPFVRRSLGLSLSTAVRCRHDMIRPSGLPPRQSAHVAARPHPARAAADRVRWSYDGITPSAAPKIPDVLTERKAAASTDV
jgi:hypothetical protein